MAPFKTILIPTCRQRVALGPQSAVKCPPRSPYVQHVIGSFIPKRVSWHQKKSSVICVNPSVKVTVTPFTGNPRLGD